MTEVWVVHEDGYDEHRPVAVFASQELAEAHAAERTKHSGTYYTATPFDVLDAPPRKCHYYKVIRRLCDDTIRVGSLGYCFDAWDYDLLHEQCASPRLDAGGQVVSVAVWGCDEDEARRIGTAILAEWSQT